MNHIAIMHPKIASIDDILSGKKKIESRWSKHKIVPWGKVYPGDRIYFKKTGGDVTTMAEVDKVISIEHPNAKVLAKEYGLKEEWGKNKNYCTLIFLRNPKKVRPFKINKSGFGSSAAWLCIEDINKIKV